MRRRLVAFVAENGQNVAEIGARAKGMVKGFNAQDKARALLAGSWKASLATLREDGDPFSSFVTVAPNASGEPVMLLSTLVFHTKNLTSDSHGPFSLQRRKRMGRARPISAEADRPRRAGEQSRDPADDLHRHSSRRIVLRRRSRFHHFRLTNVAGHLIARFGLIIDPSRD